MTAQHVSNYIIAHHQKLLKCNYTFWFLLCWLHQNLELWCYRPKAPKDAHNSTTGENRKGTVTPSNPCTGPSVAHCNFQITIFWNVMPSGFFKPVPKYTVLHQGRPKQWHNKNLKFHTAILIFSDFQQVFGSKCVGAIITCKFPRLTYLRFVQRGKWRNNVSCKHT